MRALAQRQALEAHKDEDTAEVASQRLGSCGDQWTAKQQQSSSTTTRQPLLSSVCTPMAKGMDPACPHQRGEANLDRPREQVKADFARHAQRGCEACKRMVRFTTQAEATTAASQRGGCQPDGGGGCQLGRGAGSNRERTTTCSPSRMVLASKCEVVSAAIEFS